MARPPEVVESVMGHYRKGEAQPSWVNGRGGVMRSRRLVFAVAFAVPLLAFGYIAWEFYSPPAKRSPVRPKSSPGTGPQPSEKWFTTESVDPKEVHGVWTSRVEPSGRSAGRESTLEIRP